MKGTATQPFYYTRIASSPFEVYGVQAWLLTRGSKREITQNDEFSL